MYRAASVRQPSEHLWHSWRACMTWTVCTKYEAECAAGCSAVAWGSLCRYICSGRWTHRGAQSGRGCRHPMSSPGTGAPGVAYPVGTCVRPDLRPIMQYEHRHADSSVSCGPLRFNGAAPFFFFFFFFGGYQGNTRESGNPWEQAYKLTS